MHLGVLHDMTSAKRRKRHEVSHMSMLVITNWKDSKEQPSLDKNICTLTTTSQKKCTRGL